MKTGLGAAVVLGLLVVGCSGDNSGTQSGAGSDNNIQSGGDASNCTVVGSQGSGSCNTTTTTTTSGGTDPRAPIRGDCSVESQARGICRLPPTEP